MTGRTFWMIIATVFITLSLLGWLMGEMLQSIYTMTWACFARIAAHDERKDPAR